MAEGMLSHVVTAVTNWLNRRRDGAKEQHRLNQARHVAVAALGAELDRYAACCLDVSYDDGTTEGRPASQDGQYHQATVTLPTFNPRAQQVDLTVLPADLMYAILDLPSRAAEANRTLEDPGFNDPPDFPAYFQTRQLGYAEQGLQAARLARRLRQLIAVPQPAPTAGARPRDELLQERHEQLENQEIARNKRWAASLARSANELPPQ
jgi:hypothetical protein